MKLENGTPFSRENAQSMRDAVAMTLLTEKMLTAVMTVDCFNQLQNITGHIGQLPMLWPQIKSQMLLRKWA